MIVTKLALLLMMITRIKAMETFLIVPIPARLLDKVVRYGDSNTEEMSTL